MRFNISNFLNKYFDGKISLIEDFGSCCPSQFIVEKINYNLNNENDKQRFYIWYRYGKMEIYYLKDGTMDGEWVKVFEKKIKDNKWDGEMDLEELIKILKEIRFGDFKNS